MSPYSKGAGVPTISIVSYVFYNNHPPSRRGFGYLYPKALHFGG